MEARALHTDVNRASEVPSAYDEKPEFHSRASIESIRRPNGSNGSNGERSIDNDKELTEGGDELQEDEIEGDGQGLEGNGREGADGGRLEPVKSRKSVRSVRDVGSIPDGGVTAWLQVLGAFVLFFNSWGIINTFGSYQAYYTSGFLSSSTPSAISWIGSIQAFLLLMVGMISGPIYDAGYFHTLLLGGSFMLVLGQMMLSLCHEYWQVLLAQAICIGIGCGGLFIPSVAILNTYFTTKIGFVVGIAASGSSLGGVIYPIVFHKLLPKIGFAWTTRVIGFIILGTQLLPILCMKVRVLPAKRRSLFDLRAFLIPAYGLQVFGFFVGFMGLYMPFFYGQVYALRRSITNPDLSFYLLAIMNSASIFGRIIPNFIADKLGPFNVVIPCTLISGVLCFCFIKVTSSAGLIVLMAFYGFFSGTYVSIPPTIIVQLSLDAREKIGTRLGQSFGCVAIGLLIGTPIGGAILDKSGFDAVWAFGGSLLMGSGVVLIFARGMHKGWGIVKA